MFGLAPYFTKEGAKGPQNDPKGHGGQMAPHPSAGARRRGAEHSELLVQVYIYVCIYILSAKCSMEFKVA